MPDGMVLADLAAPLFFLLCWIGYALWADSGSGHARSLMLRVAQLRQVWMRRMLARDVRIVDIQVIQVLVQSIAFFASSAVLIIGGGLAVLGSREAAMQVIAQIPLAARTPAGVWEAKVLLLIVVFVYAFFKFTWALRQFNYVVIMIGAAPPPAESDTPEALGFADRAAELASRAAEHFNKAMRTYYFGLATLSWFVQPHLFMLVTAWVVLVVYRREFHSTSLAILGRPHT